MLNQQTRLLDEERRRWYASLERVFGLSRNTLEGFAPEIAATHLGFSPVSEATAPHEQKEELMRAATTRESSEPLTHATTTEGRTHTDDSLIHPVQQVYFRAGLIACREYMARFVEAESPSIAMSIRANWWPSLGKDFGPPRQLDFAELTEGEYGTPDFRIRNADEVSPTQEALPIALGFLQSQTPSSSSGQEPTR